MTSENMISHYFKRVRFHIPVRISEHPNSHFEPEMHEFGEPEYRTSIQNLNTKQEKSTPGYISNGSVIFVPLWRIPALITASLCLDDDMLDLFDSNYIHYLGLTDEEFKSRYVLQKFYNPQE
jgi:hypothetical protein